MMGKFVVFTGLTENIIGAITGADFSPLMVMLMISLLYIVLGMVLDVWGMLILTIPFTLPIILDLGYDPVWYGVYAVIMAELALITPPVGINVYVMAKMAPDVPLTTIFRGVAPFFIFTLFLDPLPLTCPHPPTGDVKDSSTSKISTTRSAPSSLPCAPATVPIASSPPPPPSVSSSPCPPAASALAPPMTSSL